MQMLTALQQNGFAQADVIHARTEEHLADLIAAKKLQHWIAVLDDAPTTNVAVKRLGLEFSAMVFTDPIEPLENVRGERVSDTAGY